MWKLGVFLGVVLASPLSAQEKTFTLQAPDALVENGFMKYLLPRFSLKKGIRITLVEDQADAQIGQAGTPVFKEGDTLWSLSKTDGPYTDAFEEWLLSDVGKRTIEGFKIGDVAIFSADVSQNTKTIAVVLTGDVALGERIALETCGRCHVVNEKNRMNAIGSTPSFALMRNFDDWRQRFEAFYVLKPHGAFTQVKDVTPPFEEHLPPPIAPIEVTVEDIDAITAYVASLSPADLGAPIQAGSAFQSP